MKHMIQENLNRIKAQLPDHVTLVAVSKFHPNERLIEAYDAGQRIFGESHEQEMTAKHQSLPADIEWHFIGHLQTNKVKYIAPYVSMIEAVDSMKLLREIEKQAAKHNRVIPVLLELHIAQEATKYGLTLDDCRALLSDGEWRSMSHVSIQGLMMMASFTDDEQQIRKEFLTAKTFFEEVKRDYFADDDQFRIRSWGMSDDFPIAVECGSTMVRVGTSIFGHREY
jgi:pyridoxal phosphate enzyme (YggS family)